VELINILQSLLEFINLMPKVELHLHLEGTIHPETVLDLFLHKNPGTRQIDYNELKKYYRFDNLREFINGMQRITNNIQSPKDLQRITFELLETLVQQHVCYVEFDCAIQKYIDLGYSLEQIVEMVYKTVDDFTQSHEIKVNMNVNLLRIHGPGKAEKLVKKIVEMKHPFIVGIGLSGDETLGSHQLYAKAFQIAKEANLHRTAHAGEALGAESIWNAIKYLDVERIDHGTRAIEDEHLVDYLIQNNIPLNQCISSNVKLKVVNNFIEHPFFTFLKSGVCVTLNTDDPQVFDITLIDEYLLAAKTFELTPFDLKQIVLNSVEATFLSPQEKNSLKNRIVAKFEHLMSKFEDTHLYYYSEVN